MQDYTHTYRLAPFTGHSMASVLKVVLSCNGEILRHGKPSGRLVKLSEGMQARKPLNQLHDFSIGRNAFKTSTTSHHIALKSPGFSAMAVDESMYLREDEKANFSYYDSPTLRLDAMIGANDSLEDFCRSYFMFHDMEPDNAQSLFRCLPVLLFFDSYVYKLDNLNESLLQLPGNEYDEPSLGKDPWRPLITALESQGLMTQRIEEELKCGLEYWALERKYCRVGASINDVAIEDVIRGLHMKSFDYRVMSLLLYQLKGEKVNDLHMEFLTISALLVEISDDLFDYKDDVLKNTFNILRLFVKYYGASTGPIKLVEYVSQAQEKHDKLIKELEPELSAKFRKRYEDGVKEGVRTFGPSTGTWPMPTVIADEVQYRATFSKSIS